MNDNNGPQPATSLPVTSSDGAALSQELIDEASDESFPASDPPSWSPMHIGAPRRERTASPEPIPRYAVI